MLNAMTFNIAPAIAALDPIHQGAVITVLGMSIVFSGLLLLFLVVYFMKDIVELANKMANSFLGRSSSKDSAEGIKDQKPVKSMTGEEAAAICMALILYQKLHMDEGQQRITFESPAEAVSPWALSGKVKHLQKFSYPSFPRSLDKNKFNRLSRM